MSEKLIIRGAAIHMVDLRPTEAGPVARLHFVADMTYAVAEHMGWQKTLFSPGPDGKGGAPTPRDGYTMMKLEGSLRLESLSLVVSGMENKTLEMVANDAIDWTAHRIKDEERIKREYRFKVIAPERVLMLVSNFVGKDGCGFDTRGQLILTCSTVKQEPLIKEEDDDRQLQLGAEGMVEDSEAEESEPETTGPVLASARTANGGTPGRRGKRGRLPLAATEEPSEDEQSPASLAFMREKERQDREQERMQ